MTAAQRYTSTNAVEVRRTGPTYTVRVLGHDRFTGIWRRSTADYLAAVQVKRLDEGELVRVLPAGNLVTG